MRSDMRTTKLFVAVALLALGLLAASLTVWARGQTPTGQSTSAPPAEVTWGGYIAAGSVEAGYRFTDIEGAKRPWFISTGAATCNYGGMYDTLEDLHAGPRLLEETLTL